MSRHSKTWLWVREVVSLTARFPESAGGLEWEWTLRADGSIWWQLRQVGSSRERNDWQCAGQMDGPQWEAVTKGQMSPVGVLQAWAYRRGHALAGPAWSAGRTARCPACGVLTIAAVTGTILPHQRPARDWPPRFIPCAGGPHPRAAH